MATHDTAALARAISMIENQRDGFEDVLIQAHARLAGTTGRRLGITGPPGAGKSTLVVQLVQRYRAAGLRVAVVAVDPTSPFSGGALLGDRIRMEAVSTDPDVFIRSMATRGSHGGLATTTAEVADVLESFGFDRVIVETVGVGQTELDIARTADSTALVLVPESGDGIQALKSGVMEIADVFVVNKSDRPGADRLKQEIEVMLGIRRGNAFRHVAAHHRTLESGNVGKGDHRTLEGGNVGTSDRKAPRSNVPTVQRTDWEAPVVSTVGVKGEGIDDLIKAFDAHHAWLSASGALARRRGERLVARTRVVVERALRRWAWDEMGAEELVAGRLDEVAAGRKSPYEVAAEVMSHVKTGASRWPSSASRCTARRTWKGSIPDNSSASPARWYTRGVPAAPCIAPGRGPCGGWRGFGTAEDTNRRYKFLLERGQTGLSVAFDFPTLMGYDSDHARSEGEVGKCGVAISSAADMADLFDGIPLDKVSTSMTINGPASILFCFYVAAAERQGVSPDKLRGTVQNDILKEYMAQHAWVFPAEPALKIIVDMFEWGSVHTPQWNTISISGYHIREAGSTAEQELAFTLANGFTYVERGLARGLDVDVFAPRLSFFWDIHNDFFVEIAKLRAARRIWARHMKERYGARNPRSWMMRFHSQTAGVTLTAQQPLNNVVRVAYQALAAVLGGTQSLHTNSLDETLALPTEQAVQVALRTQQILAHESGVPDVIDPLGGSYYVEALTDQMEREAEALFAEIQSLGGVVRGIETGWFQRQIARAAGDQQRAVEENRQRIVGVNDFLVDEDHPVEILKVSNDTETSQRRRLARLRAQRDARRAEQALDALRVAAQEDRNVIGPMLDCARADCTLFEIRHALEAVYGAYREPVFF